MVTNIFDEFQWRGLVYDHTEGIQELLATQSVTIYNGFDPTADSLHVGHLVPMMSLARLQRFGHRPIAIAGGGTGMIGDPSGRSSERNLISVAQVEANLVGIKQQLASILDFEVKSNPARIINNGDWLANVSLMSFLRDVGKHFTVNYMAAKDSVKSRLERDEGISFTEFSYMLLQAYDFLMLYDQTGCLMQTGGSDQWGNIVAGVELIRKVRGQKAYGLVYPLITKSDGTKFGKTASGAVWLDPKRTSPYRFYQFWLNTDDAEVINYLKYFTWVSRPEITTLEEALLSHPEQRESQRRLAQEMTSMVHGPTALSQAEQASQALFGGDITGLTADQISDIFADVPSSQLPKTQLEGDGLTLIDLLISSDLANSKADGRRAIQGGGIYLNNGRVTEVGQMVGLEHILEGQFLVLRKGRKQYHLLKVV